MALTTPVRAKIILNIADFVVALETIDETVADRIHERYRQFLGTDETPHFTIAIQATPDALFLPIEPGNWVIESDFDNNRITYRSYREQGEVDVRSRMGQLEIAPTADIENFLRVVYAWLCVQNGALLLHAGGLLRHANGLGYVFFGPSGAGKTTTTGLSRHLGTILSDDLVIIRCHDDHCTLHGVPFRGEMDDAPRANQFAPLKSIYRLRQDKKHFAAPLPHAVAVAELAAAAPFVVGNPHLNDHLLRVCDRVARLAPVRELHFSKDTGFWKAIDEYDAVAP
ncbi:MAG: hypothetical protein KC418_23350 [Anaerolineales bacterium]|nr:hypothetical protein [Anaerolineales bacterium]